ncbi:phosphoglycerate kinase [Erysipelothrix larvae]|uniref:Phosphoglycerate kinase n=1 Tax=Erysipelothrix larvae TaxID=1514105 RepID=A0A0X8H0S2_9FIRM|nr:phosphoglycerate kinase [Erysipelothrix larvae]AMC93905.1 phosphoglycerate kinase [Erysipelothrix larvae]
MAKKTVKDLNVDSKKVIVRVDFNVPLKDGVITDDNRILGALPTIKYLVENNARVILMSHLGKVNHKDPEKTEADKKKNNMAPVAVRLQELLPDVKVSFVDATRGPKVEEAVNALNNGEIVLLQNTRYEPGESKNDPELGKYWASLGDLFVTDAFGSVHRAHASTVGIAENLPSALGFLVEKEVKFLGEAIYSPKRPFVAILGGAKVSDKINVIENLLNTADKVIVGGGMAYTFFKAQGLEVGTSLVEEDRIDVAKAILAKADGKLVLPIDNVVADAFAPDAHHEVAPTENMPAGMMGLDIGPETIELFKKELEGAQTVVWNGPMGVFEFPAFAKGTLEVCKAITELPGVLSVIGGGDSAAAAIQLGFRDKITHISTGGGASLEFMEGKELPGIAIIEEK